MKRTVIVCALFLAAITGFEAKAQTPQGNSPAASQDASIGQFHVIGEVTALDTAANRITIRTDAGNSVAVNLMSATTYKRALPGATSLEGATPIALTDINMGDRVMARGRVASDRQSVPAREVIVMTRADITARNERERAEWQQRGIAGTISALDPASKTITLTVRGRGGETVAVDASNPNVRFRRYAPDSIRFSDARPSRFEDLVVGDQVRALGNRSADGARFTPEEVVSGTFRTLVGTITAVNPQTNEVTVTPMGAPAGAQPLTVRVNSDSLVRRIPPEIVQMIAARQGAQNGGGAGARGGAGGNAPSPQQRPEGARAPAPQQQPGMNRPGGGAGGGMMRGGGDLREMLERLPALPLNQMQPGTLVLVSSTSGSATVRPVALAVVTGIEAFMQMMQPGGGRQQRQMPGVNPGLPGGVLDIGIGLP
jgi:Cu/Ag efflux protein CusF